LHLKEGPKLIERYGMIAVRLFHPDDPVTIRESVPEETPAGITYVEHERPAESPPLTPWITLLTSIFLHSDLMHFLINMWVLFVFGDNIEDQLGHAAYFAFFLFCGIVSSTTDLLFNATCAEPAVGASGATAGLMGAYMVLFPRAKLLSFIPPLFIVVLPAPYFLVVWFLVQLYEGIGAITSVESHEIAWWAHVGGFLAGASVGFTLRVLESKRSSIASSESGE
jgi:membrane associated rhomboid family serine protease